MKILLISITSLLLTFNTSAQKFLRSESEIEPIPTTTVEGWIQNDPDFQPSWIYQVNFVKDGKLYMLAYEPLVVPKGRIMFVGKRSVFLYAKDLSNKKNPWIAVSDTVFVGNYIDGHNYIDLNFMKKEYASGCVGEYLIEKDCIEITVGYDRLLNGRFYSEPITFTFITKNDNFYNVKQ